MIEKIVKFNEYCSGPGQLEVTLLGKIIIFVTVILIIIAAIKLLRDKKRRDREGEDDE